MQVNSDPSSMCFHHTLPRFPPLPTSHLQLFLTSSGWGPGGAGAFPSASKHSVQSHGKQSCCTGTTLCTSQSTSTSLCKAFAQEVPLCSHTFRYSYNTSKAFITSPIQIKTTLRNFKCTQTRRGPPTRPWLPAAVLAASRD